MLRGAVAICATIAYVETVRYTYRLRPGSVAQCVLEREGGQARWVWNECVATDRRMRAKNVRLSHAKMDAELTRWRAEHDWLSEGSQNVQQQTVRTWWQARQHSFKVKGRRQPTFHAKDRTNLSMNYTRNGFKIEADRLVVAKCPPIPVVWSRDLPSEPSSVRIYRDSVGDWWASFVTQREVEQFPAADAAIGIDWGVTETAITTSPEFDLPHAEHGKHAAAKLAICQRQMSRRKPIRGKAATRGYRKAKRAAAKAHRKVARQRQDTARKWARNVVENHNRIAVEDFKPKFLAKTTMARKVADANIGATKRVLIEYGQRANRDVVLVPPAYTTMTCSDCGTVRTKRLPLSERTFRCYGCGLVLGRDLNAARTILVTAGFNGAGADCVRHDQPFMAGLLHEPGIPVL